MGLPDPAAPPWLKAGWNNRRLLQDAFGAVATRTLAHSPHPHRVSVLQESSSRFAAQVDRTARSPFRSDTDLSLLRSLAQHYGLLTGKAYSAEPSFTFVNLSNADVERQLNRVLDRDQDFFCLGDHHDYAMPSSSSTRCSPTSTATTSRSPPRGRRADGDLPTRVRLRARCIRAGP